MATPCNSELAQAPFQTYRDPKTGEWQLETPQDTPEQTGKVIPFRPITKSLTKAKQIIEKQNKIG
ncbi:hypothetical protein [[Limnothrix rosea] IAM M-220]|uniref:hypothetical protein n=1 Tax=[Limnothrix rosea] IAM M-220 TaxID=454133 RepID=UPI00095B78DE|nr:hypothetical protein [[Limnothrix rosea] IAM M-220]OKH18215.1 hypothetical protein NIES208_06740 [[Limnothrix rosea] IAM M-220]